MVNKDLTMSEQAQKDLEALGKEAALTQKHLGKVKRHFGSYKTLKTQSLNAGKKALTAASSSISIPASLILLGLIVVLIIILLAGIFFMILPTSILGEASDLTHDQRDEAVIKVSTQDGNTFATTTQGLIQAVNAYKAFWNKVDLSDSEPQSEATGLVQNPSSPSGTPLAQISADEFRLICAIIGFESGDTYDGALAVATCVANRIAEGTWTGNWERSKKLADPAAGASDPLSVLTASGQFAAYIDYYYLQYLDNPPEDVQRAVIDCFCSGKRSHKFTCFRSYETTGSTNIEGNWYFDTYEGDTSKIIYTINTDLTVENPPNEETSQNNNVQIQETSPDSSGAFQNTDPSGEEDWDLLYLICAYDASKNNLEGVPKDSEGKPVTRYWDLLYGIGEYIIKAAFGVEIEVKKEVAEETAYPVYEPVELAVLKDGTVEKETFYKKTGEETTKIKIIIPKFEKQPTITTLNNYTGSYGKELVSASTSEESPSKVSVKNLETGNEELFETTQEDELYLKTEGEVSVEPQIKTVTETKRVRGLQKSVLLSVLGLAPGEPYKVLEKVSPSVTNSDYIEYSRTALINVLGLKADDFRNIGSTESATGNVGNGTSALGGSALGWVWPLDPEGYGSFTITSLMGTRESPGGIGSTDHGGTDIGAATGVAILAVEDGTVEIAGEYGGYGNAVRLNHNTASDGNDYKTLYGHMSRIACSAGDKVKKGDVIGYVGSTGWSTGPHLHFEVICNGEKINGLSMYDESIYNRLTYAL